MGYNLCMKKITKSHEDYLEAIYILEAKKIKVQSVEIARLLGVSKPAVHKAMGELLEAGLITKEKYSDVTLTDEGREIAKLVFEKHNEIKTFLIKLGVDEKTAESDCCQIEHVISDITLDKIKKFNQNN